MGTAAPPRHRPPDPTLRPGSAPVASQRPVDTAAAMPRPASAVTAVVLSAAGLAVLSVLARGLLPQALEGHAEAALLAWVLVALASVGVVLCAYLVVVWTLVAAALVLGPASRSGRALVAALRVIAPRVAQRLTIGAAIAGATSGLILGPATAVSLDDQPAQASLSGTTSHSLGIDPPAPASVETDRAAAEHSSRERGAALATLGSTVPAAPVPLESPDHSPHSAAEDPGELPPLGWGQQDPQGGGSPGADAPSAQPPVAQHDAPAEGSRPSKTPTGTVITVVVQPGDTLWSITDQLLGPDPDPAVEIAGAWPAIYDANRDRIGPDPDHLVPGQELLIPAHLTVQEKP